MSSCSPICWLKPLRNNTMQSHEIDYRIIGHDIQMVEIELDPGETVIAEAGAMTYLIAERRVVKANPPPTMTISFPFMLSHG